MNIEFIFAEFGPREHANQQWQSKVPRLDPTYSSIKQYFPDANIVLYTDQDDIHLEYPYVEIRKIDVELSPFSKKNHRWGWHCCDYYQAYGLLTSKADIAISVDSDLMFVSDQILVLPDIIKRFGICVPTNERQLVKIDGIITRGNDGDYSTNESLALGNILTYDLWWAGFDTKNDNARIYLTEFCRLMETNPRRAPLQMSRAAWNTGVYPYSMPQQWGVGSGYIGCTNEIILHVGHTNVQDFYLKTRI